jgi:cyclin B
MSTALQQELENKENIPLESKPRPSVPRDRTFGNDLTKALSYSRELSNDPQLLDYYSDEIYQHLKSIESLNRAKFGFMKSQADITEKMRSVLLDWLVEVHHKFKLTTETLFLAVNLIDRYLEKVPISRARLQLIGVSAFLIASKYEDIYPPEIRDMVYITDNAFTKQEILQGEIEILKKLEYNITVPSSFRFLERLSRVAGCSEQQHALSRYLQELALVDYKMMKYSYSNLAAAAIYLMFKIKNIKPEWTSDLRRASGYTEDQLKACARDMCMLFQNANKSSLKGVKNKFSSALFFHVANTPIL